MAAGRIAEPVAAFPARPVVGGRITFERPARGRHGPATGTLGFELTGLELFLLGTVGLMAWYLGLFKPQPPAPASGGEPKPGGSGLGGPGPSITPAAGAAHGLSGARYDIARLKRAVVIERRSYYATSGAVKAQWLHDWLRDYTALYLAAPGQAALYEKPPGWKPPAEEGPPSGEPGGAAGGGTPLVVFGPEPTGPSGGKASTDTGIVGGTRLT